MRERGREREREVVKRGRDRKCENRDTRFRQSCEISSNRTF